MLLSLRRIVSCLIAGFVTWIALAGTLLAIVENLRSQSGSWLFIALAPSLAILSGWWGLRILSQCQRMFRIGVWAIAIMTALATCLVSFLYLADPGSLPGPVRHSLPIGEFVFYCCASVLIPILVIASKRSWQSKRAAPAGPVSSDSIAQGGASSLWLRDIGAALVVLVILSAIGLGWFNYHASVVEAEGLKRWEEIGRPMPEFARSLKSTEENDSFKALMSDLQPYGITSLYKDPNQAFTIGEPSHDIADCLEAIGVFDALAGHGDAVVCPPERAPKLAAQGEELRTFYRKIASRPAPVWAYHPGDGVNALVPTFLFLRKTAQVTTADVLLRLARGDHEGARNSTIGNLRLTESFQEGPELISIMIRVAIEALAAKATARLPAEPGAWERLARDADVMRASIKLAIQNHALKQHYLANGPTRDFRVTEAKKNWSEDSIWVLRHPVPGMEKLDLSPIPVWIRYHFLARPLLRLESGKNSKITAGEIDAWNHENLLTAANICGQSQGFSNAVGFQRAWARLNMTLLIREHAEVIAYARAEMAAGRLGTKGEHPSVVIPGAKWEITADPSAHTAAFKLTPLPAWAIDTGVTDDAFLILPLDGSKSWKFELP